MGAKDTKLSRLYCVWGAVSSLWRNLHKPPAGQCPSAQVDQLHQQLQEQHELTDRHVCVCVCVCVTYIDEVFDFLFLEVTADLSSQ